MMPAMTTRLRLAAAQCDIGEWSLLGFSVALVEYNGLFRGLLSDIVYQMTIPRHVHQASHRK